MTQTIRITQGSADKKPVPVNITGVIPSLHETPGMSKHNFFMNLRKSQEVNIKNQKASDMQ